MEEERAKWLEKVAENVVDLTPLGDLLDDLSKLILGDVSDGVTDGGSQQGGHGAPDDPFSNGTSIIGPGGPTPDDGYISPGGNYAPSGHVELGGITYGHQPVDCGIALVGGGQGTAYVCHAY